jgi:hypothetical protein
VAILDSTLWFDGSRPLSVWLVALSLFFAALVGLWCLRRSGRPRVGIVVSLTLATILIGWWALIEKQLVIEMAVPILTGPPATPGSEGTVIDNDGAVRGLVLLARDSLPSVVLGLLAILTAWTLPANRARV